MMTFAVIQRMRVDERSSEGSGMVETNEDAPAVAARRATTTAAAAALRMIEQFISGKSRLPARGVLSACGCVRRRGGMDGWIESFI
jgi:hypothetical protein